MLSLDILLQESVDEDDEVDEGAVAVVDVDEPKRSRAAGISISVRQKSFLRFVGIRFEN